MDHEAMRFPGRDEVECERERGISVGGTSEEVRGKLTVRILYKLRCTAPEYSNCVH